MWFPFLLVILGVLIAGASRLMPDPPEIAPPNMPPRTPVWYRILTWGLVVFGMVAILTIGIAFLLTGLTLAVLGPWRTRPAVFWPPLIAIWTFVTTFVVLAPFSCSQTATTTVGQTMTTSPTTCTNLIGINYSGSGNYNPPLMPALLIGLSAAILAGVVSRVLMGRQVRRSVRSDLAG